MYYTTPQQFMQGENVATPRVLEDFSSSGRRHPWREKKMNNELLSYAYESVDQKKAERLRECGDVLRFRVYETGEKKLDFMNSCRVRLCPLCSWRRSLKAFYHTNQICVYLAGLREYRYVMLTLTVRNCAGDQLGETIDTMMHGWNRFMQRKRCKTSIKGWMRSLEITHNTAYDSDSYDTYHPHFHVLLCVGKRYFTSEYISKKDYAAMWRESCRLDYDPVIDVRVIKADCSNGLVEAVDGVAAIADAVGEAAKYTVKDSDYIIPDDWDLTVSAVETLDKAIDKRRLLAFGGVMADAHRALHLDDEDNGDLVNVGDQGEKKEDVYRLVNYFWYSGARDESNYYER